MTEEIVKGFRDFTGEEALKREAIRDILVKNFKLYGFEPAETPVIEFESFVKGENQGDEAVSDIFKLQDKGKRNIALRYEFTFQLKRISQNKKMPYKRYQIGEVFRDEPTSSNRFRQFTQCDVDVVGSTVREEAEILALASKVFKELGIKVFINFNNRKLLNEILDKEGIKSKAEVIKEIDKLDKLSESEVKKNLKKYKAEKVLPIFKKQRSYFKKYSSYKEIEELENACKDYGIEMNFQPFLARGLSYYNGTIIEVKTEGIRETLAAGGSYLINGVQSTGIAFGLNRIFSLAKTGASEKRVVIISIWKDSEAIGIAENLRDNGIPCSLFFNKVSKALEYANSYMLPYVIFFGEDEAKKKKVKLRDMKSGKEELVDIKKIVDVLKKS
jgi:histidyl-tRNA synthetase